MKDGNNNIEGSRVLFSSCGCKLRGSDRSDAICKTRSVRKVDMSTVLIS